MDANKKIRIGILTPHTAGGSHFEMMRSALPHEIELRFDGMEFDHTSRYQLAGTTEPIKARSAELVARHELQGLVITSAPLAILNPDLESKVREETGVAVTTAPTAAIAALKVMGAKKLIVLTPFDVKMNGMLQDHLAHAGFTVLACPAHKDPTLGSGPKTGPDEIFATVQKAAKEAPGADTIYFQGAPFNPLPIIGRIETELKLPVVASNPAMMWHILSLLGCRFTIPGYGKLLESWPKLS
jgi:maleate cis-trans isomerase